MLGAEEAKSGVGPSGTVVPRRLMVVLQHTGAGTQAQVL